MDSATASATKQQVPRGNWEAKSLGGLSADAPAKDGSAPATAKEASLDHTVAKHGSILDSRMVVRTADMHVRVSDVEKAERAVNRIVLQHGGYVQTATSSDLASDHPSMAITLRVPVGYFDDIVSGFESLGVRTSKSITSQDVTEQVVDMDARMKTLLTEEETFRGILRNTQDMSTIITLQDKLTELRSTIESIAAQRKSLAKQASFSTITLTLDQSATINPAPKDPNWIAEAWGESTGSFSGILRSLATAGIWLTVFSPVWLPLLFFALRGARQVRKRYGNIPSPSEEFPRAA
jgi:hypothetical protein